MIEMLMPTVMYWGHSERTINHLLNIYQLDDDSINSNDSE